MALVRNTLVFLDTNFWGNFRTTDQQYRDILKYSKDEKIVLCTSKICLEEWRAGKVKQIKGLINKANTEYSATVRDNLIADEILQPYPVRYPHFDEVDEKSKETVSTFITNNKIRVYEFTEQHAHRSWKAYFEGLSPFSCMMNREDILAINTIQEQLCFLALKNGIPVKDFKEYQLIGQLGASVSSKDTN